MGTHHKFYKITEHSNKNSIHLLLTFKCKMTPIMELRRIWNNKFDSPKSTFIFLIHWLLFYYYLFLSFFFLHWHSSENFAFKLEKKLKCLEWLLSIRIWTWHMKSKCHTRTAYANRVLFCFYFIFCLLKKQVRTMLITHIYLCIQTFLFYIYSRLNFIIWNSFTYLSFMNNEHLNFLSMCMNWRTIFFGITFHSFYH